MTLVLLENRQCHMYYHRHCLTLFPRQIPCHMGLLVHGSRRHSGLFRPPAAPCASKRGIRRCVSTYRNRIIGHDVPDPLQGSVRDASPDSDGKELVVAFCVQFWHQLDRGSVAYGELPGLIVRVLLASFRL